jgi:hypothetical protein
MQFNDNVRVYKYKDTVTKVTQLRHKLCTCVSTTMPTLCSTPKKSCALHFATSR